MTEEDAAAWLQERGHLSGLAGDRLRAFCDLVVAENERQNLIAASTIEIIWSRHVVDSLQLLEGIDEPKCLGEWVDIGSGAGFPGLAIACVVDRPVLLVEMRALRAAFLNDCISALGLRHVRVEHSKVEDVRLPAPASVISARAYAPLSKIFAAAGHLANADTTWILPKGRNAEKELAIAKQQWQAMFHVKRSVTDSESGIIVARAVAHKMREPAGKRSRRR